MGPFTILYQDTELVIIEKPFGFHVHPPETKDQRVPRNKIILHQLRDQLGTKIYPLHRLDVSTTGVLAFALSSSSASFYAQLFQAQKVEKTYWAIVRGFLPDKGEIDQPLTLDSTGSPAVSKTIFKSLRKIQLPEKIGTRQLPARYTWAEVQPQTGRFHQIRRHMNRISHPVIGDATHGDSRHNRFFREKLQISGLCLRAIKIRIPAQKTTGEWIEVQALEHPKWQKIQNLFEGPSFTTGE